MEHQKILNLLNESNDIKFVTRRWDIANDNSKANYNVGNEIIYNTEASKANLCDYNHAYILVKGDITSTAAPIRKVAFKNCAPFTKFSTKIDGTTTNDAENLNLVMPMYSLVEYRPNYSESTGSLWFYSKDEATNFNNNIADTDNSKSFNYKAKLLDHTVAQPNPNHANGILKNVATAVPLKYLINFWRSLEMSLINCKVELSGQSTVFCLYLVMIIRMTILIILFLLSKTENYMFQV